ncbi:MAG: 50S ribosomal protein L23 [Patescibacteria group bacterium]
MNILLRPRITEKSGIMSESQNIFTFEVSKNSTKDTITREIKALYKINPTKIRIINIPAKRVFVKGKKGTSSAVKKALVYLKKGDKINFI